MFSIPRSVKENTTPKMAMPDFYRIFAKGNGKPN